VLIIGGSFALQKWFSSYLKGILCVKMRDFASKNAGRKECGYIAEELNFLANTICMLPRNKNNDHTIKL